MMLRVLPSLLLLLLMAAAAASTAHRERQRTTVDVLPSHHHQYYATTLLLQQEEPPLMMSLNEFALLQVHVRVCMKQQQQQQRQWTVSVDEVAVGGGGLSSSNNDDKNHQTVIDLEQAVELHWTMTSDTITDIYNDWWYNGTGVSQLLIPMTTTTTTSHHHADSTTRIIVVALWEQHNDDNNNRRYLRCKRVASIQVGVNTVHLESTILPHLDDDYSSNTTAKNSTTPRNEPPMTTASFFWTRLLLLWIPKICSIAVSVVTVLLCVFGGMTVLVLLLVASRRPIQNNDDVVVMQYHPEQNYYENDETDEEEAYDEYSDNDQQDEYEQGDCRDHDDDDDDDIVDQERVDAFAVADQQQQHASKPTTSSEDEGLFVPPGLHRRFPTFGNRRNQNVHHEDSSMAPAARVAHDDFVESIEQLDAAYRQMESPTARDEKTNATVGYYTNTAVAHHSSGPRNGTLQLPLNASSIVLIVRNDDDGVTSKMYLDTNPQQDSFAIPVPMVRRMVVSDDASTSTTASMSIAETTAGPLAKDVSAATMPQCVETGQGDDEQTEESFVGGGAIEDMITFPSDDTTSSIVVGDDAVKDAASATNNARGITQERCHESQLLYETSTKSYPAKLLETPGTTVQNEPNPLHSTNAIDHCHNSAVGPLATSDNESVKSGMPAGSAAAAAAAAETPIATKNNDDDDNVNYPKGRGDDAATQFRNRKVSAVEEQAAATEHSKISVAGSTSMATKSCMNAVAMYLENGNPMKPQVVGQTNDPSRMRLRESATTEPCTAPTMLLEGRTSAKSQNVEQNSLLDTCRQDASASEEQVMVATVGNGLEYNVESISNVAQLEDETLVIDQATDRSSKARRREASVAAVHAATAAVGEDLENITCSVSPAAYPESQAPLVDSPVADQKIESLGPCEGDSKIVIGTVSTAAQSEDRMPVESQVSDQKNSCADVLQRHLSALEEQVMTSVGGDMKSIADAAAQLCTTVAHLEDGTPAEIQAADREIRSLVTASAPMQRDRKSLVVEQTNNVQDIKPTAKNLNPKRLHFDRRSNSSAVRRNAGRKCKRKHPLSIYESSPWKDESISFEQVDAAKSDYRIESQSNVLGAKATTNVEADNSKPGSSPNVDSPPNTAVQQSLVVVEDKARPKKIQKTEQEENVTDTDKLDCAVYEANSNGDLPANAHGERPKLSARMGASSDSPGEQYVSAGCNGRRLSEKVDNPESKVALCSKNLRHTDSKSLDPISHEGKNGNWLSRLAEFPKSKSHSPQRAKFGVHGVKSDTARNQESKATAASYRAPSQSENSPDFSYVSTLPPDSRCCSDEESEVNQKAASGIILPARTDLEPTTEVATESFVEEQSGLEPVQANKNATFAADSGPAEKSGDDEQDVDILLPKCHYLSTFSTTAVTKGDSRNVNVASTGSNDESNFAVRHDADEFPSTASCSDSDRARHQNTEQHDEFDFEVYAAREGRHEAHSAKPEGKKKRSMGLSPVASANNTPKPSVLTRQRRKMLANRKKQDKEESVPSAEMKTSSKCCPPPTKDSESGSSFEVVGPAIVGMGNKSNTVKNTVPSPDINSDSSIEVIDPARVNRPNAASTGDNVDVAAVSTKPQRKKSDACNQKAASTPPEDDDSVEILGVYRVADPLPDIAPSASILSAAQHVKEGGWRFGKEKNSKPKHIYVPIKSPVQKSSVDPRPCLKTKRSKGGSVGSSTVATRRSSSKNVHFHVHLSEKPSGAMRRMKSLKGIEDSLVTVSKQPANRKVSNDQIPQGSAKDRSSAIATDDKSRRVRKRRRLEASVKLDMAAEAGERDLYTPNGSSDLMNDLYMGKDGDGVVVAWSRE